MEIEIAELKAKKTRVQFKSSSMLLLDSKKARIRQVEVQDVLKPNACMLY